LSLPATLFFLDVKGEERVKVIDNLYCNMKYTVYIERGRSGAGCVHKQHQAISLEVIMLIFLQEETASKASVFPSKIMPPTLTEH
jgi:hypothetical protein